MSAVDKLELRTLVREIANRRPAVGLAIGVVRNGSLDFFQGHGVAEIGTNRPIDEDTVFRVGSITKTFTAIAVLQLCEQGLVDLDAPAHDYLRAFRLVPTTPGLRPATVRHLLTHTAGIPEVLRPTDVLRPLFGEILTVGRPVPSPARLYRDGLRVVAQPGTRFTYTDHGFATLGQIVVDVSGQPFDRYLREHVFEPLGMAQTDLVRSTRIRPHLACGYTLGSSGAKAVADYELITAAGGGAYSTTADMARYVAALLAGGANDHGAVLKPATLATMFEPHYQPDPRLPGIGLAFWRGSSGGHRVVEHGGILPGFTSEMFLAPDDGVGVLAFTNGARQAMLWLPGETAGLLNHLIGVRADEIRTDLPQHPEVWGDICGWYRVPSRLTDVRMREMTGAGVEVFVRGGQLRLRVLTPIPAVYRGFPLHPDDERDPYAFRIDLSEFGIGTMRVVFSREPETGATAAHVDQPPLSAWKQPAATNPRRWATGALGALAVATTALAARRRRLTRVDAVRVLGGAP
jgi:CubicO group peptidase (beta-lactamase class C family)